ncbi:fibronectin type III domain-containing protein [bacterium]|nr:fibronectin type III domain-containing protein [bacterium]
MRYEKILFSLVVASVMLLSQFAAAGDQSADKASGPIVQIKDARLKIETNATDSDAGIQVLLDADPWKVMRIFDPTGKMVFESKTAGRFGLQGGTELFLESAEPDFVELPFDEFLARFLEGTYKFRGIGLEGERYVGEARLTHDVPEGPELVSPLEGGKLQNPKNTVLLWRPVDAPNGSPIVGYQVIVVQLESQFPAIPKVTLDIMMPATATRLKIPDGFLLPDTEYEWEVLAIEAGGNQTLSTSFFKTLP